MEQKFATLFEDNRHESWLILLLLLSDPDILRQSNFKNNEVDIKKSCS